jgi:hypothetical protein
MIVGTRPVKSLLRTSQDVACYPLCRANPHTNVHTDEWHPVIGQMVGNSGRRKTRPGGVSSSATCRSMDWQAICVCVDLVTELSEGKTSLSCLCPPSWRLSKNSTHAPRGFRVWFACGFRSCRESGKSLNRGRVRFSLSMGNVPLRLPCFSGVIHTIYQACGGHVFACFCMCLQSSPFRSRSLLNGPHFSWYCLWNVIPGPKPSSSGVAGGSAYHTRRVHTFSKQIRNTKQPQFLCGERVLIFSIMISFSRLLCDLPARPPVCKMLSSRSCEK